MKYSDLIDDIETLSTYVSDGYIQAVLKRAADAIEHLNNLCMDLQGELKRTWDNYKQEKVLREQLNEGLMEAVERIPKWIPVKESLPEGEVIAVNALKGSYGYREYIIGYVDEDYESDSGYSCESEGEILVNVTHWMPLPEPPREETE